MTTSAVPYTPSSQAEGMNDVAERVQAHLDSGAAVRVMGQRDGSAVMQLNRPDGKIAIWDARTGEQIRVPIEAQAYYLNKLISPTGARLHLGWVKQDGGHSLVELDGKPTMHAFSAFPLDWAGNANGSQTEASPAPFATADAVAPHRTGKSRRRGRRGRRGGKAQR